MRLFRRASPSDRRAARLVALGAMPQSQPNAPMLSTAAIAALCRAIPASASAAHAGCALGADDLRSVARLLAAAARDADAIRAERLLIVLKGVWATLPEVQQLPAGGPREAVWSRLVTLCIEEFYAPAASSVADARQAIVA